MNEEDNLLLISIESINEQIEELESKEELSEKDLLRLQKLNDRMDDLLDQMELEFDNHSECTEDDCFLCERE